MKRISTGLNHLTSDALQADARAVRPYMAGLFSLLIFGVAGCSEGIQTVSLGLDDNYYIPRMSKLFLRPALSGAEYRWTVDGDTVSEEPSYIFMSAEEGTYCLSLDIIDPVTPYHFDFTVTVMHEDVEYSPWISRVYEYCPAPGQFINELPPYTPGDTYETMRQKAEDCISGTNDVLVSLGGFGGYITFGFDHTVMNIPGEADFCIWGNAFYELTDPDSRGGSAEPGIVMVSLDTNGNGLPDDTWYELAGSEYASPSTVRNYCVIYHSPDPSKAPVEDEWGYLTDTEYIPWTDSEGGSGFIARNTFHTQEYWPQWISDQSMSFTGTRLAPNGRDASGTGRYYILYAYPWGYVDNHPNDYAELNSFDISRAVDASGQPVSLPGADFVRVYTGVNQYCGWLGESSTEITRAQDLHISLK